MIATLILGLVLLADVGLLISSYYFYKRTNDRLYLTFLVIGVFLLIFFMAIMVSILGQ